MNKLCTSFLDLAGIAAKTYPNLNGMDTVSDWFNILLSSPMIEAHNSFDAKKQNVMYKLN